MNSHIYNLQERTECTKAEYTKSEPKLRLWVINYEVKSRNKGVAVVKAKTVNKACAILLSNSKFNAYKEDIDIVRIEEIITYDAYPDLLCEEYVDYEGIVNPEGPTNPDINIQVNNGILTLDIGKVSNKVLIL